MPEELRTGVHNIVQEAVSKTIPKKKKYKKAKWLSEEALQIVEERREVKDNGRKGKICPTECRVPEKGKESKKAFFNKQCQKIEESNRTGEARDLFKKTGGFKGIFHAKMSTIKDRNSMDLREAEEI